MYYPYFRGKQFELILLREQANIISVNPIRPIIEPVKSSFRTLETAVESLVGQGAKFTIVVNPQCGELIGEEDTILDWVEDIVPPNYEGLSLAYIVNQETNVDELIQEIEEGEREDYSIIHYGYTSGRELAHKLSDTGKVTTQIFIEGFSSKLYQKHFKNDRVKRVLIRDGFKIRKNALYPEREHFSDLHLTYDEENVDGFGDFLIVGDEFREAGGPAFAVAIHMTYLN